MLTFDSNGKILKQKFSTVHVQVTSGRLINTTDVYQVQNCLKFRWKHEKFPDSQNNSEKKKRKFLEGLIRFRDILQSDSNKNSMEPAPGKHRDQQTNYILTSMHLTKPSDIFLEQMCQKIHTRRKIASLLNGI